MRWSQVMTSVLSAAVLSGAAGGTAQAACCRLLKLPTEPAARVQACQPDATEECGSILWEADLAPGEGRDVCPSGGRVVYREWDAEAGAFGPATTAICDEGRDVEL